MDDKTKDMWTERGYNWAKENMLCEVRAIVMTANKAQKSGSESELARIDSRKKTLAKLTAEYVVDTTRLKPMDKADAMLYAALGFVQLYGDCDLEYQKN